MNDVVELHDVSHVYVSNQEAFLALQDIQFSLKQSEFVSLVGPSGCGKTTILSIIAGLIKPTLGQILVEGNPISKPSPQVGYMLQQDYLFPWSTIFDNSIIGLKLMKQLNEENKQYAEHLLEEMGLANVMHRYPHELSGGMRQRVALVRTLVTRPNLLLLDEPFSALDYQTKLQLEDLLAETLKEHNKTALLVTHDISEAIAMSDRILIMDRNPGRIRKELIIPEHIRNSLPFIAREQEGFHHIFNEIWQELDSIEGSDHNE